MDAAQVFTPEWLEKTFPPQRTEDFFDALFGDAEEGAYDIRLRFERAEGNALHFAFDLHQRPGKCLVCNLTYGLPQVFSRHPVINMRGIAQASAEALGKPADGVSFQVAATKEISPALHYVPFTVTFE